MNHCKEDGRRKEGRTEEKDQNKSRSIRAQLDGKKDHMQTIIYTYCDQDTLYGVVTGPILEKG